MNVSYIMSEQNSRRMHLDDIIKLLLLIKSKINDQTDVVWTRFNSPADAIADLDADIAGLTSGDTNLLGSLSLKFAPTGPFQEISISNGWGGEFLEIANKYDLLIEKLNSIQII